MSRPRRMGGPPRRILLATDLSARCDRALDRAASLAGQWGSQLIALHVVEDDERRILDPRGAATSWRRSSDPEEAALRQLRADIGEAAANASVVIGKGSPAEAILRTAEARDCDLVVTGVARDELLGRFSLGMTVDRLLRRSRIPLLVAKDRVRGPYRHIMVAADFSKSSRHALEAAARFFPEEALTVFHAHTAPMAGTTAGRDTHRAAYRKAVEQDWEAFVRGADMPDGLRRPPRASIGQGAPDRLVEEYARDGKADIVVLGTHGRSALFEVFIGSVARRIMSRLACDALVIREPRAATER